MIEVGVVLEKVFDVFVCVPPRLKKYEESTWELSPPETTTLTGVLVSGLMAVSVKRPAEVMRVVKPPIPPVAGTE